MRILRDYGRRYVNRQLPELQRRVRRAPNEWTAEQNVLIVYAVMTAPPETRFLGTRFWIRIFGDDEHFPGIVDYNVFHRHGASLARSSNREDLFLDLYGYHAQQLPPYNRYNPTDEERNRYIEHRDTVRHFEHIVRTLSFLLQGSNEPGRFQSRYRNHLVDTPEQLEWIVPYYQEVIMREPRHHRHRRQRDHRPADNDEGPHNARRHRDNNGANE